MNYSDTGLFGLRFTVLGDSQDDAHEVVSLVQRQWKHAAVGLTDEEVDRAKNQLRTVLLGQLEDGAALAHSIATRVSLFPLAFDSFRPWWRARRPAPPRWRRRSVV